MLDSVTVRSSSCPMARTREKLGSLTCAVCVQHLRAIVYASCITQFRLLIFIDRCMYQSPLSRYTGVEIDGFVIAGGSKRGWTTWLTGAVDRATQQPRVKMIVPIVYDELDFVRNIHHHFRAYGDWYLEWNEKPQIYQKY